MLNGTITSLSDKWSSNKLNGTVIIITQPRTIVRGFMDHAGLVENLSMMQAKTLVTDLYYKG